ncbi:MAG TPA: hypothetical protein VIM14_06680 [Polyangia bacterium]
MHNRKILCCVLMVTAGSACKGDGLATDSTLADDGGANPSASRLAASVSCPNYPGMVEISAACMFDSNGKAYAEDGTLYVFPAAPPYGAKFVFKAGFVPQASDVTAQGADASIGVYAAPYNVASGTQCCSEDSEANRIEATTDLSAKGELTITVSTPIPSGYQIAIILDFGRLYRSRLSPPDGGACNLPSQESCTYSTAGGFAMRFYVGSVPGGTALQPTSPTDPATVAAGTCLLAYNDALVSGDPCCYRKGAKNSCNTMIACNDRSGAGCCLIYGTESTRYGGRCCLYADGGAVDGADECQQLLTAP